MSTPVAEHEAAPLRADAARNRQAIICAAANAYASGGSDISLEQVAKLAGVGVGTMYRRFPTKQSLLEALFEGKMLAYADHAEKSNRDADGDPKAAFEAHLRFILDAQASDLGFSEMLRDPVGCPSAFQEARQRAIRAGASLVDKARRAGVVCPGFREEDVLLAIDANHGVISGARDDAAAASGRFADYVLTSFLAS